MFSAELIGFSTVEERMLRVSFDALESVGHDVSIFQELIRVDMPPGRRGMTLEDGAALGAEAFSSQDLLNHVLEEELLHLQQKSSGRASEFGPGTVRTLEEEIHEARRFPAPE